MKTLMTFAFGVAIVALVSGSLLIPAAASAQTPGMLTIPLVTLVQANASTHNGTDCGTQVPSTPPEELSGVLVNGNGSYFGRVHLPDDATITAFYLTVHDNSADTDAFAYLARKFATSQTNFNGGYLVLASVRSTGAAAGVRRFHAPSITRPLVDNRFYGYFVEVINCGTVEMISVQVQYTTP